MGFPSDAVIKTLPANAGDARDTSLIPGLGRCPEKEMTTHSSILAWKIPWTEEPGGLQCMESQRLRHDWACTYVCMRQKKKSTSVIRIWCQSTEEIGSNMYIIRYMFLDLSYTHSICKYVFINIHIFVNVVCVCTGYLTWSVPCPVLVLVF